MLIGIDASKILISKKTGTENYSSSLIKAISKIDRKNQYLLYLNPDKRVNLLSQENFQEVPFSAKKLWTQYHLAKELFKKTPGVLFVPAHTLPVIRPSKLKTVVTIHDLGAQYLPQYHQRLYLNKSTEYVLKHADHIIAVSEATKREILNNSSRDDKTVTTIYEGYNEEYFNFFKLKSQNLKLKTILNKYNLKKSYLLFVGTIQPRKNLLRLIQAFAQVNNSDLDLVFVGKKGWLFEDILKEPQKLGVEEKVKFLDYVQDVDLPYLYYGAKCFVFPSLCEGFGIPLLEAMAVGCPIITSNISSMPEIAGNAAIFVDPFEVKDIKLGIEKIIFNTKLCQDMAKNGLQRVKNFSWEKAAQETVKVFEKVANQ